MATKVSAGTQEEGLVSDQFILDAIDEAQQNALRCALYQVTGDPEVKAISALKRNVGGREFLDYTLDEEGKAKLKEKAFAYLRSRKPGDPVPPPPTKAKAREILEMFSEPLDDDDFEFSYEELALDEWPRDVHWTNRPPQDVIDRFKVIVIGAGISGIMAAIQFKRLGIGCTVIERQGDIGGTWALNTYPNVRVDTSSYLYQFKFEKNYRWSEYYPSGAETKQYLHAVVDKHGVRDRFRLNTEVTGAQWDEAKSRWIVTVEDKASGTEVLEADLLVSASGLFAKAKEPDFAGVGRFRGETFHTTRWDHSVDLKGKRVAVIGTGSTAIQVIPGVAPEAEKLTVYQRTPNWIMPQPLYRKPISDHIYWLFDNMPYYWNWYSFATYYTATQMQYLQEYDHDWIAQGGVISKNNDDMAAYLTEYIHSQVGDRPDLIEKLVPKHAPLTRRMAVDCGFYETLKRDDVELVAGPIREITETGIVGSDGIERPADVIVFSTGFAVQQFFWPIEYVGRDGITLNALWERDGARSHIGLLLPGFPNFLFFYGPNGQPRSGGFYSWAEIWARYIGGMAVKMIENGIKSFDIKRDVFDRYNVELDAAMKEIIWERQGHSYYVNEHGRAALNVPFRTQHYHAMVREPDLDDFELR